MAAQASAAVQVQDTSPYSPQLIPITAFALGVAPLAVYLHSTSLTTVTVLHCMCTPREDCEVMVVYPFQQPGFPQLPVLLYLAQAWLFGRPPVLHVYLQSAPTTT